MKLCERLHAHSEITVRTVLDRLFVVGRKCVAFSHSLEEFINNDPAVFAFHVVFICFILIKNFIGAFIMRTGSLCHISFIPLDDILAIIASTLLVLCHADYTHDSPPFPFFCPVALLTCFFAIFFLNRNSSLLLEVCSFRYLPLLIPYILTLAITFTAFQQGFQGLQCLSVDVTNIPV